MPKLTLEDLKKGGHAWNVYGDEAKAREVYEKLTALGFKPVFSTFLEAAYKYGVICAHSDMEMTVCSRLDVSQERQISDIPEPEKLSGELWYYVMIDRAYADRRYVMFVEPTQRDCVLCAISASESGSIVIALNPMSKLNWTEGEGLELLKEDV